MNGARRISCILSVCWLIVFCLMLCGCKNEPAEQPKADVSVLTWNIFQATADVDALLLVLQQNPADVVCFQEANNNAYGKVVTPFLTANTDYKLACDKVDGHTCRTPVLYDCTKLVLVDSGTELFTESYQGSPSKSVAWCVFDVIATGKRFVAANIHGAVTRNKYDGLQDYTQEELDELAIEWRVGNVKQATAAVKRQLDIYGQIPAFICGDCNFAAGSLPYLTMTEHGYRDSVAGKFKSVHEVGIAPSEGNAIDHVFVNDKASFLRYDMLADDAVLAASDHCPLVAELLFE